MVERLNQIGKMPAHGPVKFTEAELAVLEKANLFKNIERTDLISLLTCLQAVTKKYKKNSFIQRAGDPISYIGIVLKGSVEVIQEDALGRKTILTSIGKSGIFGEAVVTAQIAESPVSVSASEETVICFLNYNAMVTTCGNSCMFHTRLIQNMLEIMAMKAILLSRKLNYVLMKSIRDKVMVYLLDEYQQKAKKVVTIPYNREELAAYLSVDRSALSRELSRMKEEGLIRYRKNQFSLDFIREKP